MGFSHDATDSRLVARVARKTDRLCRPLSARGSGVAYGVGELPNWRVTLLVDGEAGPLPAQVETLETRLPYRLSLPTYCEAPIGRIEGGFAKVRTGGLTPEATPSSEALADFLIEAVSRRIAFKATAGLHHPIRSLHPLTYATDSPCATMHGFVNVFVAAAFAWQSAERNAILDMLNDADAGGSSSSPASCAGAGGAYRPRRSNPCAATSRTALARVRSRNRLPTYGCWGGFPSTAWDRCTI